MKHVAKVSHAPDAVRIDASAAEVDAEPILIEGQPFFRADSVRLSLINKVGSRDQSILLALGYGAADLHAILEPSHARPLAEKILAACTAVELEAQLQADAAIARAAGKGAGR